MSRASNESRGQTGLAGTWRSKRREMADSFPGTAAPQMALAGCSLQRAARHEENSVPLSLCQAPNQLRSNRLANKGDAKMQDHGDLPRFFRNLIAPVSCLAWSSFFCFFFFFWLPCPFFFVIHFPRTRAEVDSGDLSSRNTMKQGGNVGVEARPSFPNPLATQGEDSNLQRGAWCRRVHPKSAAAAWSGTADEWDDRMILQV